MDVSIEPAFCALSSRPLGMNDDQRWRNESSWWSGEHGEPVPDTELAFRLAVQFSCFALHSIPCFWKEDKKPTLTAIEDGRLISLSMDDWFELYGLLMCARSGPCNERWSFWCEEAKLKWEAWQTAGQLHREDAKVQFYEAVTSLPGHPQSSSTNLVPHTLCSSVFKRAASSSSGSCDKALEVTSSIWGAPPYLGVVPCVAQPPMALPMQASQVLPKPTGGFSSFVGRWRTVRTHNMDQYLKRLGVPAIQRSVAVIFNPMPVYHEVDGRLSISMATPLGQRIECLDLQVAQLDMDPQGRRFLKTVQWQGDKLVSTFRSRDEPPLSGDIVTERWIDDKGQLVQVTSFENISFTRHFMRLDAQRMH